MYVDGGRVVVVVVGSLPKVIVLVQFSLPRAEPVLALET